MGKSKDQIIFQRSMNPIRKNVYRKKKNVEHDFKRFEVFRKFNLKKNTIILYQSHSN